MVKHSINLVIKMFIHACIAVLSDEDVEMSCTYQNV